ncbi:MAG: polymer-forming cytoskeletal protein [archaeon GB-1845-036]|nr:polymer-forming cytoskeletal protein [Candidatus Culexmicrobium thermophilum]
MSERLKEYEDYFRRMPQVKISGSGRVGDEEVSINGSGIIMGDLKTKQVKVSGSAKFLGNVKADFIKVSGSASFNGDISCGEISISGSAKLSGKVKSKTLRVSGSINIGNSAEIESLAKCSGSIRVNGNLKCKGLIDFKGSFEIFGNVDSKIFNARLKRQCKIKGDLNADEIEIIGEKEELGLVLFGVTIFGLKGGAGRLYVKNVKAHGKVHLENVVCNDVVGKVVEIGKGCEVRGTIKYHSSINIHPEAKISSKPVKLSSSNSELEFSSFS